MKRKLLRFTAGFRVAPGNRRSEAAEMVIRPGGAEGDSENRHRGADQWLFVLSGRGIATVNDLRYPLRSNVLLLIEHCETLLRHEPDLTLIGLRLVYERNI